MTKEEYAAAFPWAENARRLLLESRDQAHGVELLIAAGIDEETAEHLAAHHCGTFRGDIIEIPLSIAEPAPIA